MKMWTLAQAAPAAAPGGMAEMIATFTPMLVILGIFYLLVIRPQQSREANRQAQLERVKKDDEVVTIGGLIGTVVSLTEDRKEVTLKIADNTRVRVLRSAIQSIVSNKS
jgi:preprotein translocase subunit YajC